MKAYLTPVTLIDFLLARLDEDEVAADFRSEPNAIFYDTGGASTAVEYLEHFTWQRALREVVLLRRMVAEHPTGPVSDYANQWGGQGFGCATCHDFDGITTGDGWCATLRLLASIYADHPDYDPAWQDTPET